MRLRLVLITGMLAVLPWRVALAEKPATGPSAHAATTTAAAKLPLPTAAELRGSAQLVESVYKDDLAAANTPALRLQLAQKMLDASNDEKQLPRRYALLDEAMKLACQAGDLHSADMVVDLMANTFDIDALKMKSAAVTAIRPELRQPEKQRQFVGDAMPLLDAAMAADRYDVARAVGVAMQQTVDAMQDPQEVAAVSARLRQVEELQTAYAGVVQARAVLAKNPEDPAANLKVGTFRCLLKNDWDDGLPHLARGSDATLKALAQREWLKPEAAGEQLRLADDWWKVSEERSGLIKQNLQSHALQWYDAALPKLEGLEKVRVEKRIAEATANGAMHAGVVNLLALVDIRQDAQEGIWSFNQGVLSNAPSHQAILAFPYRPPLEYDLHVVFAREEGQDGLSLILVAGEKHVDWVMGFWRNTVAGFHMVNGKTAQDNETTHKASNLLENGKKYDVMIKVRKDRIQAYINGVMISSVDTTAALSAPLKVNDPKAIGVFVEEKTAVKIFTAELTDVGGSGTIAHDGGSAASAPAGRGLKAPKN